MSGVYQAAVAALTIVGIGLAYGLPAAALATLAAAFTAAATVEALQPTTRERNHHR